MSKLYEIANEYAQLSNSGMDEEQIKDTLEGISGEFEDKALNILAIIKNELALEAMLKAEAKSLTERAKAAGNHAERLKNYLASTLEVMELPTFSAGVHKLTIRGGAVSVQIDDLEKLPPEYVDYQTTIKPDKNLIKEKIKLGEKIDGASLVVGKSSVIIK